MRNLPKTFKLFDRTYTVRAMTADDKREKGIEYGYFDYNTGEILIDVNDKPELNLSVFCHELTHAILDALDEDDLSENETFVTAFGSLLAQFLKTRRGKL